MVVSLANLDAFREAYSFVASDDVLRAASMMIQNVMHRIGNPGDFLGHLGATDFVLITSKEKAPLLKERIRSQLEQSLEYFYPVKDREQTVSSSRALAVELSELDSTDGSYADTEALRSALLARKA
jgi:GGDEF domain-containing protein